MMEAHWTVRAMNWQIANRGLSLIGILAVSLLSSLLTTPLMYRKKRVAGDEAKDDGLSKNEEAN